MKKFAEITEIRIYKYRVLYIPKYYVNIIKFYYVYYFSTS